MNNEKYPREPVAALGLAVVAVLLLVGTVGAAEQEWLPPLVGFGTPILIYFLFPPGQGLARAREYGPALIGGIVVAGEALLWASADSPFFAASIIAAAVAASYVALYVLAHRWRRIP